MHQLEQSNMSSFTQSLFQAQTVLKMDHVISATLASARRISAGSNFLPLPLHQRRSFPRTGLGRGAIVLPSGPSPSAINIETLGLQPNLLGKNCILFYIGKSQHVNKKRNMPISK